MQDQRQEALELHERALIVYKKTLGSAHHTTLECEALVIETQNEPQESYIAIA